MNDWYHKAEIYNWASFNNQGIDILINLLPLEFTGSKVIRKFVWYSGKFSIGSIDG